MPLNIPDVEYVDDSIAFITAQGLGESIEPALLERKLPGLCYGGVMPGAETAFDYCGGDCSGLWWVRVGLVYPSENFSEPDYLSHSKRNIILTQQYEVGLVRSIEAPNDGEPADLEVLAEAARLQLADMRALLNAICGYFRSKDTAFVIGAYTPYGPQGLCVGGSWSVTAGVEGNG